MFSNLLTAKSAGILLLFVVATVLGIGTGKILPQGFLQGPEQRAESDLGRGNYSAALVTLADLKNSSSDDAKIIAKYEEAKSLFVAEELFKKAKKSAEGGAWLDAKVLLDDESIVLNPDFKYYGEAVELYKNAEERVAILDEANEQTISKLEQLSEEEKARAEQISADLQSISVAKKQTEQKLISAQGELASTQDQANQTQAELEAEQQKAQELANQIAKEQLMAFVQELKIYADMLTQGEGYIDEGLSEIYLGREINTLVFMGQAKSFFEEVEKKTNDLRANRTPGQYIAEVDLVIQSAGLYLSAGRSLRNAVVYIEDQQGASYINEIDQASNLKSQARNLLNQAYQFINANSA